MNHRFRITFTLLIICLTLTVISCGLKPFVFNNQNMPSESSPAKIGRIVFGESYEEVADASANNDRPFKIVNPRTTFKSDDPFAFVVMSEEPYGKTQIELVLSEVSDKGSELVVLHNTQNVADPAKHRNTANQFEKAEDILSGQKSGKYRLRCFRDDTLLAVGEFTYQSTDTK